VYKNKIIMPLRLGTRYGYHDKISTNACDDEDYIEDNSIESQQHINVANTHTVMYIGQENLKSFSTTLFADVIDKLYSKNFSKISSFILKKYSLTVDTSGISVNDKSSSKKVCTYYNVGDINYLIDCTKHDRVIAIVLKYANNKGALHVYLTNSHADVESIIHDFHETFKDELKGIKKAHQNFYCNGIEIEKETDHHVEEIVQPFSLKDQPAQNEFGDFQDFQTVPVSIEFQNDAFADKKDFTKHTKQNVVHKKKYQTLNSNDYEDEFADLALKRNPQNPDHLQDKSIESSLLVQEKMFVDTENKKSIKHGMFSSYSKLAEGDSLINF